MRRGCGGWRRRSGARTGRRSLRRWLLALVFRRLRLRLRDDDRIGLRLGWRARELHRREGGRGKQHEAKVCHDGLVSPGKVLVRREGSVQAINSQRLGIDCGESKTPEAIYFNIATT